MKKIMIPCLAVTLLLGSTAVADAAGAESSSIEVVHKMEGKKRGLENALERVKNPIAREAIKRNLEQQEEHKKHKREKKHKKDKESEKEDVSLSIFTVGGVEVKGLTGLTTAKGATLRVNDFSNLSGIKAEAEDDDAEVTVSLNGSMVHKDYLNSILLSANDVIVVKVKDDKKTQNYKVTLVKSEDISLDKFTVGGVDVSTLAGITSNTGAVLKIDNFNSFKGIVVETKNNAEVTVTLNGSAVHKDYLANIPLRLKDVIDVKVKEGNTTQTFKVTLQQK